MGGAVVEGGAVVVGGAVVKGGAVVDGGAVREPMNDFQHSARLVIGGEVAGACDWGTRVPTFTHLPCVHFVSLVCPDTAT